MRLAHEADESGPWVAQPFDIGLVNLGKKGLLEVRRRGGLRPAAGEGTYSVG